MRVPFWVKLAVIVIAGAVAMAKLGPQPESVVAILSWMLIASGAIQIVNLLIPWLPPKEARS